MAKNLTTSTVITYSNGSTSTLNFSWSIDSLKVKQEGSNSNAVIQTYWTLAGTDGSNNTGTFKGATPFTTVGMSGSFIPFEQLKESDVVGWVQGVVVGQYADHVYEQIQKQLDSKVVEVTEPSLPWAPPVEDTAPPIDPSNLAPK